MAMTTSCNDPFMGHKDGGTEIEEGAVIVMPPANKASPRSDDLPLVVMRKIDTDMANRGQILGRMSSPPRPRDGRDARGCETGRARGHRFLPSDASTMSSASSSNLSLATVTTTTASLLSVSPTPSSMLSPASTDSSSLQHEHGSLSHGLTTPGWLMSPRSRASLDSPITPASFDDTFPFGVHPSSPPPLLIEMPQEHDQMRALMKALPIRPKRRRHRESWDSGLGSDVYGRHTRDNSASTDDLTVATRLRHDQETAPPLPSRPPTQPQPQPQLRRPYPHGPAIPTGVVLRAQARLASEAMLHAHTRRRARGSIAGVGSPRAQHQISMVPLPHALFAGGPLSNHRDTPRSPEVSHGGKGEDERSMDCDDITVPAPVLPKQPSAGTAWDDETASNTTMAAEDAAGRILNYALDVEFGLTPAEVDVSLCRSVVYNFISDLTWAVAQNPPHDHIDEEGDESEEDDQDEELGDDNDNDDEDNGNTQNVPEGDATVDTELCDSGTTQQFSRAGSSASGGTRFSQGSASDKSNGKRKERPDGDDDDDQGRSGGGGDGNRRRGNGNGGNRRPGPQKRARVEQQWTVRMSCPYRKKNPLRFNVRDHRLCATTDFYNLADIRRHIKDFHSRPANAPLFACPRCQDRFYSEQAYTQHIMHLDGLCEIRPSTAPGLQTPQHNPEDGIDKDTADQLIDKKGRTGDSPEVQWQKMWALLFPGSGPAQPYDYCAVMEHFEMHERLLASMPSLRETFSSVGYGANGINTIEGIVHNHLVGLFEACNLEAQHMEVRNRQVKTTTGSASIGGGSGSGIGGAASPAATGTPSASSRQPTPMLTNSTSVTTSTSNSIRSSQLRPKHSSLRHRLDTAQRDSGFVDGESIREASDEERSTPALMSDEDGSSPGLGMLQPIMPLHQQQATVPIPIPIPIPHQNQHQQHQPLHHHYQTQQPPQIHHIPPPPSSTTYGFPPVIVSQAFNNIPTTTTLTSPTAFGAAPIETTQFPHTFTVFDNAYNATTTIPTSDAAAAAAAALAASTINQTHHHHCAPAPSLQQQHQHQQHQYMSGACTVGGGADDVAAWPPATAPYAGMDDSAIASWLEGQPPALAPQ